MNGNEFLIHQIGSRFEETFWRKSHDLKKWVIWRSCGAMTPYPLTHWYKNAANFLAGCGCGCGFLSIFTLSMVRSSTREKVNTSSTKEEGNKNCYPKKNPREWKIWWWEGLYRLGSGILPGYIQTWYINVAALWIFIGRSENHEMPSAPFNVSFSSGVGFSQNTPDLFFLFFSFSWHRERAVFAVLKIGYEIVAHNARHVFCRSLDDNKCKPTM